MGIRVQIGDDIFETSDYTVQEDSTPTKSSDSSGSVGVFTFSIPNHRTLKSWFLIGKEVSLIDTRRGTTVGFVSQTSESDDGAMVTVQCQSRLGKLNIYDVQAQPFVGTLRDGFFEYLSLAGQDFDLTVDSQIADRPVVFPGWTGELWFYLKQMAAAQDCEISLVSNVILLRPLRQREAVDHRSITRSRSYGGNQLARAVEVYHYDNTPITNKLVYPPNGWNSETEIISVGAGETVEYPLELSASVSSIQQPVMQTFVSPEHSNSSVYTVVGDDGLPIPPAQWRDNGGSLVVRINPDTVTLTVEITAPNGIRNKDATPILNYQIALAADNTGSRYSTLRIIGSGVSFNKEVIRVRTCIDDRLTGTDVGITIDNPFLSTVDQAYSAGVRAARLYAGHEMLIDGELTTINLLGDNGSAAYPKYSQDQTRHQGKTYAQVKAEYNAESKTYNQIEQDYIDEVREDFENQVFGNAGGARVWDETTLRYYRVRSASINTASVQLEAEDDLTYADVENTYYELTYDEDKDLFPMSYVDRDRSGLYVEHTNFINSLLPSDSLFPADNLLPR